MQSRPSGRLLSLQSPTRCFIGIRNATCVDMRLVQFTHPGTHYTRGTSRVIYGQRLNGMAEGCGQGGVPNLCFHDAAGTELWFPAQLCDALRHHVTPDLSQR